MSSSLADLVPGAGERAGLQLWLKSSAYCRRLLLGESVDPWESASQYLAYFSQAHGLLKPDVAVLELGELFDSWLRRHPALRTEMAAKRKLSFPLRKLLEQPQPREVLAEVVAAVLAHLRGQVPLVLAMPSPRYWLQLTNEAAGRPGLESDPDSIEDAAMYMADLVRAVSTFAVGGLLFEEAPAGRCPGAVDVALYLPLVNVAKHYRWPLALRLGGEPVADGPALAEFDVLIGATDFPAAGRARGVDVSQRLWSGQALPEPATGQFYFVEIPPEARPEQVLDSLALLRAATAEA